LREQVITPRATGRSGSTGAQAGKANAGGIVQRPARRERGASAARSRDANHLRQALAYFPHIGKALLAIITGLLIFAGYRAAASASFFQARSVEVNSTSRVSADEIKTVVRRAVAGSGVWDADLNAISAELQRVPWVRSAVVSRVLPDGLRVRVTERVPRAVVRTSAGKLVWVDTDAVVLGPMLPTDQIPTFFIRGLDETGTGPARALNRERMQKYEEILREWEAGGLSERVSEVNLDNLRDVRAQLAGEDSQIEVRLGAEKMGEGLSRALRALDEQRQTPCGPFINYLEVLPKKIIVGHAAGAGPCSGGVAAPAAAPSALADEVVEKPKPAGPDKPREERSARSRESRERATRKEDEEKRKKAREKKEKESNKAKTETRPRRVG
jgi:cell division protein FtsQ